MRNFNQFPQLATENQYAEQFDYLQETALFQKLQEKFTPLPYYQKYKGIKWIALIASYLFNLFSGITASTLVYFFLLNLTGNWVVSTIWTVTFIGLIELAKRKTNGIFFKDSLQFGKLSYSLLAIGLLLLSLSVSFSYFGSKQLIQKFTTPPPPILNDTLTIPLNTQITAIDSQIQAARATKWKGTTTTASQRTIETLSNQKLVLQQRLYAIENQTDQSNKTITEKHEQSTTIKSEYFAAVTFLLELLFILCAYYLEYYDYRSFAEFTNLSFVKTNHYKNGTIAPKTDKNLAYTSNDNVLQNNANGNSNGKHEKKTNFLVIDNNSKETIDKAIKNVKSRIASAQYRLRNGIGRPETSNQNIAKFNNELHELEALLNF